MSRKKSTSKDLSELQSENEALKEQLRQAKLKIEGYQIMGDILKERLYRVCHVKEIVGIMLWQKVSSEASNVK